ncbi:MAG: asparaginase [Actinomycetia bacterium]|nr:asparaginase [Actinomycetes bacterium]
MTDPVLVEVVRGDLVESVHHARAVVVAPGGEVVWSAGAVEALVFARSSSKPMQAVAMLRCGLDVSGAELAVCGASHLGEPFHLEAVRRVLAGAGLGEADLQNTPDLPISSSARTDWLRAGRGPEPITQNCSGKHSGMLRACVRSGWPTDSYRDPGHPLQQQIRAVISEYASEPVGDPSVDGCGAPVFATSLVGLARSFGRIAAATEGPAAQVAEAYREHPEYVSGTGHDDLLVHRAVPGLICKGGAEGVMAAGLPDGTGAALKIMDGGSRGRRELMVHLLRRAGVDSPALEPLATSPVLGHGEPVGVVRVAG